MPLPPNLNERLAGVKAKLDRAEEQLDTQDREWVEWREREDPWGAESEIGDEGKRIIFTFRVLKPNPPRFSVITGEIVHDMRSALDHLASYLVELHGGKPSLVTAWPLEPSSWIWRRKVERRSRQWQLWRQKGGGPLKGIPRNSAAWALIHGSQPYMRSDKARNDPLWGLHQLWNADKHRTLHLIPLYTKPERVLDGFEFPPGIEPIRRKVLAPANRPLKDGTKLALFEFADPVPRIEVKIRLAMEIALSDKESEGRGPSIRDTLEVIRDLYEGVAALPYPAF